MDSGYIDLIAFAGSLVAGGGTWTTNGNGSWSASGNWSCNPAVPSSGTVTLAGVPGNPSAPIAVTLDGFRSADALVFDVSNANGYTLAQGSGGALTLGASSAASIAVRGGSHAISAPLVLASNLTVSASGGTSLTLSGGVYELTPGSGLILNGGGQLIFSSTGSYTGDTTVSGGTLQIVPGGQLPAANEFVGTSGAASVVQTGGNNVVTSGGFGNGLLLGYIGGSSGYYTFSDGQLSAPDEWIGYFGHASFTQSGGTNSVSSYLSIGTYGNGTYSLSGGLLAAQAETIGDSGIGLVVQSGGTNAVTSDLTVGYLNFFAATYNLSGSGQLSAANEYIGSYRRGIFTQTGGNNSLSAGLYVGYNAGGGGIYELDGGQLSAPNVYLGSSGTGAFTQTGGNHTVSSGLYLGFNPGSSGTYYLSGSGQLSAAAEYIGNGGDSIGGIGVFTQTGGTNAAANVNINDGYYLLGGGLLQPASGGTLQVNNGGLQTAGGILDCGGGSVTIQAASSLVDLSYGMVNTGSTSLAIDANSLLIVAPGFDSTTFASYANLGLTETLGSTLNVPGGIGFGGWGSIADHVACSGTIAAAPGGWINLNNGLFLADPGEVNLGSGTLTVEDTSFSGMTGGALAAFSMIVGQSATGSFAQSGGSIAVGSLVLAQNFGSAGTYNLNAGLLSLYALTQGGGAAAFNIGGGTLQAASDLSTSVPMNLSTAGSNAVFDTNGNALTLYGPLSGPGGLSVAGSGTLTLGVSNSYTGTTLVSNGTLTLADSNALSGSTFDTTGTGTLNLQGGIGGFSFGGLQGSGNLLMTDAFGNDLALTVGDNNSNTTFSGALSDSNNGGSLTKVGTGTLTLSGTNTYLGGTTVLDGTLVVINGEGLADGSSLTVGDPSMFPAPVVPSVAGSLRTAPVPEPGTLVLLIAGGALFAMYCMRR